MISKSPPTQQKIRAFFEDNGNEPVQFYTLLACIDVRPDAVISRTWAMKEAGELVEVIEGEKVLVRLKNDMG